MFQMWDVAEAVGGLFSGGVTGWVEGDVKKYGFSTVVGSTPAGRAA
jgi:hypothetical protein